MKKFSGVFVFFLLLGCSSEYSNLNDSIDYRLLSFEHTDGGIQKGDVVYCEVNFQNQIDPIEWSKEIFIASDQSERFEGNLGQFHEGDVMDLKIDKDYFQRQKGEEDLEARLVIKEVLEKEKIKFKTKSEQRLIEQVAIEQYLFSVQLNLDVLKRGVYVLESEAGTKGDLMSYGKPVLMHYKTYLLDGKLISSSEVTGPISFSIGQKGQVLEGVAKALSMCAYGDKIKVLIPSDLAFGDSGSANIVAPFSPLIMEIECLDPNSKE